MYSSHNGLISHPHCQLSFSPSAMLASFPLHFLLFFYPLLLSGLRLAVTLPVLRSGRARNIDSIQIRAHGLGVSTDHQRGRSEGCGGSRARQIELGLNKLCLRLLTMGSRVSPAKQKLGTHYSEAGPQMIAPVWAEKSTASTSPWSCSVSHSVLSLHLPFRGQL